MSPKASIRVLLNGEWVEIPGQSTVASIVAARCESQKGVAVAVDREVIARSDWISTALCEGASVEIVTAAAGG